jgi:signal transduction histidine kinase
MPTHPIMDPHSTVPSLLALSAALLEARDEDAVLRAVMRVSCELILAEGCVFIPFGEYMQTLPVLEFGRIPVQVGTDWDTLLTHPSTRSECKACAERQGGTQCVLLRQSVDGHFVHCVPLSIQGREAGLFSFIFPTEAEINEQSETLLAETIHLGALAIETISARMMTFQLSSSQDDNLQPKEIETRAILGERMRLAREIHDGLAQTLAFLKIEVGRAERMLEQDKSDSAARVLHDTARTLSDAYLDARQAIENLRRVPDGNLAEWLKQVAEDFESVAGQNVDVELCLERDLPSSIKVQMIRIVQEALTNVRKHAAATRVVLSARAMDGILVVEVRDNGRGFVVDSPGGARFGLRGMRERAEAIGAELQVDSLPATGTTVRLSLSLPAESAK